MFNLKKRNEFLFSIADDSIKEIVNDNYEHYVKSYDYDEQTFDYHEITMLTESAKEQAIKYRTENYFDEEYTYVQFMLDCKTIFSNEKIQISVFCDDEEFSSISSQIEDRALEEINYPTDAELASIGAY